MPIDPINVLADAGAPAFVTADPAALLASAVAWFEAASGHTLSPSQVEMYLTEMAAYMLSIRAIEENTAISQCFIAWATGNILDTHGADRNMPRLQAEHAIAIARLTRLGTATGTVLVPAGTRFAVGDIVFRTISDHALTALAPVLDVSVEAVLAGEASNAVPAGALRVVDPVFGLASAALLTVSAGGTEREPDDRYRARLATAFERINRGGSRAAYRSIVMEWSAAVRDCAIIRSSPGHIDVYPLMTTGAPTLAQRNDLAAYLDGKVPEGDYVSVIAPTAASFNFVLTLLVESPEAEAAAEAAVDAVLDDWRHSLGGYIAPSDVILAARSVAGVIDADVNFARSAVAENAWRNGTYNMVVSLP